MTVLTSTDKGPPVEVACDAVCDDSLLDGEVHGGNLSEESMLDESMQSLLEGDVVISGIACRLPNSDNMAKFQDNLASGTNTSFSETVNRYGGSMRNLDKFDASFFGIPSDQVSRMDPQLRMLLELTAESLIDAGLDPCGEKESNTAVYVGMNISHAHEAWSTNHEQSQRHAALGCTKNMMANRISKTFHFTGPSYSIQGSDVAGSLALERAYQSISECEASAAVVAGSSLCLKHNPILSCGQTRHAVCGCHQMDGLVVLVLQRYKVAKRRYTIIVNSRSQISPPREKVDNVIETSVAHYPTLEKQVFLLKETYLEAAVDPDNVEYVETHTCGLCEHDMSEVTALTTVLGSHDRDMGPLLIGSVRSSVGHLEAASGLASVARALLSMEDGIILPSCYTDLETTVDSVDIVREPTQTLGRYMAVNSLGKGGYHIHTILRPNDKRRLHYCLSDNLRLCVYAGATENGLKKIFKIIQKNCHDMELHALLNETATISPSSFPYRGYCILNHKDQPLRMQACCDDGNRRPVWYLFTGIGSHWTGMGRSLMTMATFRTSILESSDTLKKYGINLYKMITSGPDDLFDKTLNSFIGITAIQIALVQLLHEMDIEPDGILGHSVGEIASGYADGSLTAEEAILAAYWCGFCIQEANLPPGLMAEVGLTWKEAAAQCPVGVSTAYHNCSDIVTVTGTVEAVQPFLTELRDRQVYVKELNTAGVAFHSPHMQEVVPIFKEYMSKLIIPKKRTSRWVSTCIPEGRWDSELATYCSVDYLVTNLTSPVLFHEGLSHIPDDAIVVEIGPHGLLQSILSKSLGKMAFHTSLMSYSSPDNVTELFKSLGECYLNGLNLNPLGIFPPVQFPVSQGTPMISPLISWDHSKSWDLPEPSHFLTASSKPYTHSTFTIDTRPGGHDHYLTDHVINGCQLFPATGYVLLAWKTLATAYAEVHDDLPVCLEKIVIHRPTILSTSDLLTFDVTINAMNEFEIIEGDELVCSGTIIERSVYLGIPDSTLSQSPVSPRRQEIQLSGSEIYRVLQMRGFEYGHDFQTVFKSNGTGENGLIQWTDDWMMFMEGMFQMLLLSQSSDRPCIPVQISSILINPVKHTERIWNLPSGETVNTVMVDRYADTVVSGGVSMHGVTFTPLTKQHTKPVTQQTVFIPYIQKGQGVISKNPDLSWYAKDCQHLAVQSLRSVWDSLTMVGGLNHLQNKSDIEKLFQTQSGDKFTIVGEVDMRNYANCENCGLLMLMEKIEALPAVENFLENLNNLFEAYQADMLTDQLLARSESSDLLKPCLDVVCENLPSGTLRILEVVGQSVTCAYQEVVDSISSDVKLGLDYSVSGIKEAVAATKTVKWSITEETESDVRPFELLLLNNVLSTCPNITKALRNAINAVSENGFILVEEPTDNLPIAVVLHGFTEDWNHIEDKEIRSTGRWLTTDVWIDLFDSVGLKLLSTRTTGNYSSLFLLRKPSSRIVVAENQAVVKVGKLDNAKMAEIQKMTTEARNWELGHNLWLVADNQHCSGVAGMVKSLAKKDSNHKIRCLLLEDTCPNLSLVTLKDSETFQSLVTKDLVMNIYKGGEWGSYRHMPLDVSNTSQTLTDAACVYPIGIPAEPTWVVSPLNFPTHEDLNTDLVLCYPHYASVTGATIARLRDTSRQTDVQGLGMEFSGLDGNGQKVMGLTSAGALSSKLYVDRRYVWSVPDGWSLQQACTVPLAYSAAYYALVCHGNIKKNQSVLIIGSNTISLAAINVALHEKCDVLVAMETKEARTMMMEKYGDKVKTFSLKDSHFFVDVKKGTKMRGVDVLFDCLMDPNIQYSTTYLRPGGHFIQYCPQKGVVSPVESKYCTVSSIKLDNLDPDDKDVLSELVTSGLQTGVIRPFEASVYERIHLKAAFEAKPVTGKYVLLKIAEESTVGPSKVLAQHQLLLDPKKSYIISRDIEDFGLELGQWLIDHGASKLVLNTRSQSQTGYQARKLHQWKMEGVTVRVSNRNVTSLEETKELIQEAKKLGPVGGIFHVAMVQDDRQLSKPEVLEPIFDPKVAVIHNLDQVTRSACSRTLDYFVTISSLDSDLNLANEIQSAYAYANSTMEHICERRKKEGFTGLSVQLGSVADVAIGSEMVSSNGSTGSQVGPFLQQLEQLMLQSKPAVLCRVPISPGNRDVNCETRDKPIPLLQAVCQIIGVPNLKHVKKEHLLVDFGLDALKEAEIHQMLKKKYNIILSSDQIAHLKVNDIVAMSKTAAEHCEAPAVCSLPLKIRQGRQPETSDLAESVLKLNDVNNDKIPMFLVMDEDSTDDLQDLVTMLECPVFGLTCSGKGPFFSVPALAGYLLQQLYIINCSKPLILAGHKYGCVVAVEMALQLQDDEEIRVEHVICIEGSQSYVPLSDNRHLLLGEVSTWSAEDRVREALKVYSEMYTKLDSQLLKFIDDLDPEDVAMSAAVLAHHLCHREEVSNLGVNEKQLQRKLMISIHKYLQIGNYKSNDKYKGNVTLIRGRAYSKDIKIAGDYNLSEVCSGQVLVHILNNQHEDLLNSAMRDVAATVNATHTDVTDKLMAR